jgi:hypothetical protein
MTQRPVAKMCDHNLIAAFDAFGKRTGASDFNIIGMATNGKNIHFYRPLFVFNYDITLPRRPQASIPAIRPITAIQSGGTAPASPDNHPESLGEIYELEPAAFAGTDRP